MAELHKTCRYSCAARPDWFPWAYLSWCAVQHGILLLWWTVIREQFLSTFSTRTNLSGEEDVWGSNFLPYTGDPQLTNSKLGVRLIRALWLADAKIHINCPTSVIESCRYGAWTSRPDAAPTPNNESIRAHVLATLVCKLNMSKKTLIGKEISTVLLKQERSNVACLRGKSSSSSSSGLASTSMRLLSVLWLLIPKKLSRCSSVWARRSSFC